MDGLTRSMLENLYAANLQSRQGFQGIIPALKSLTVTEDEKKKIATISHNYLEITRLLSVIEKDLKTLI